MCEKNDLVDFEKQIESSLPSVLSSPSVMKRKSKDQLMNALLIKEVRRGENLFQDSWNFNFFLSQKSLL